MKTKPLNITCTPDFSRIHYRDLEDFLGHTYGVRGVNVLKRGGFTKWDHPIYHIKKIHSIECLPPKERIHCIRRGNLQTILITLCVDSHIPPGKYILDTEPRPEPLDQYKKLLRQHRDPLHRECIQFKNRHSDDRHFRRVSRVIDQTLCVWLRRRSEPT